MSNARMVATQRLIQVIKYRQSLSEGFDTAELSDSRDQALAQNLCYGVLRWLPKLQAILRQLMSKPLKAKDIDIEVVLLIGLYQQLYLRIPPHAAISATVEVAHTLKKSWATSLINAVLRNCQRQRDTLLATVENDLTARLAHPAWLLALWQQEWPTLWETIAHANNQPPPLTLRVNRRYVSRADYLQLMSAAKLNAYATPHTEMGITLTSAVDVNQLPEFQAGWVSVQDGAAQLAAPLLEVPAGARVLDACAAPGGKTAHLLEYYDHIEKLVALDCQPARVEKLKQTLQRLQLTAEVNCADATKPDTWWDGQPFSRILLDAPCSGTGVIRRHPDIKYLRQPTDLTGLTAQQTRLLETLWPLLLPGGKLLYVTCSMLAAENSQLIARFLATHPEAQETVLTLTPISGLQPLDSKTSLGLQILPGGDENFDGFYYAGLIKTS